MNKKDAPWTDFMNEVIRTAGKIPPVFLARTLDIKVEKILERLEAQLEPRICQRRFNKVIYAFLWVINPKFSRKKFATVFNLAYGSVKNWAGDKVIDGFVREMIEGFTDAFMAEIVRLISLPQEDMKFSEYLDKRNTALHTLFAEASFYGNDFLVLILFKSLESWSADLKAILEKENEQEEAFLKGEAKEIEEIEGADLAFLLVHAIDSFIDMYALFHGLYDTPEKLDARMEQHKEMYQSRFLVLQNQVLRGNTQKAIEGLDLLEKDVGRLQDDVLVLQKELIKLKGKAKR